MLYRCCTEVHWLTFCILLIVLSKSILPNVSIPKKYFFKIIYFLHHHIRSDPCVMFMDSILTMVITSWHTIHFSCYLYHVFLFSLLFVQFVFRHYFPTHRHYCAHVQTTHTERERERTMFICL